jgi:amidase
MRESYHGRYYAKAQNLGRKLTAAYDAALESVDLLVMPTLPMKATPLPPADAPREEVVARALEMIFNTCPFDVTGHPAMTVPCGLSEGLPVGLMLVGKRWGEETVLRAAHAFEQTGTYNVKAAAAASR